jgi:hypothetical protein
VRQREAELTIARAPRHHCCVLHVRVFSSQIPSGIPGERVVLMEGEGLEFNVSLSNTPVAPVRVVCTVSGSPGATGFLLKRVQLDAASVLFSRAPSTFRAVLSRDTLVRVAVGPASAVLAAVSLSLPHFSSPTRPPSPCFFATPVIPTHMPIVLS